MKVIERTGQAVDVDVPQSDLPVLKEALYNLNVVQTPGPQSDLPVLKDGSLAKINPATELPQSDLPVLKGLFLVECFEQDVVGLNRTCRY